MSMLVNPYAFAVSSGDPSFSSTKLLLGFEGADASTTFTDESAAARGNASVFGNAQIDTAQFKFGSASGLFDGSGDYLTYANSSDWDFGSGAFTIECFVRLNTSPGTGSAQFVGTHDGSQGWRLRLNNNQLRFDGGTTGGNVFVAWTPTLSQWYHLAVDRVSGGTTRLYLDGVYQANNTSTSAIVSSGLALHIGRYANGAIHYFDGWIDELRITKGVARYDSDGGFTVPTAAYPRS